MNNLSNNKKTNNPITKTALYRLMLKDGTAALREEAITQRLVAIEQEINAAPEFGRERSVLNMEAISLRAEQDKLKRAGNTRYLKLCNASTQTSQSVWDETSAEVVRALNAPVVADYLVKSNF